MVTELISAIERCPPGDLEEAQQRLQERKEALPETAPRSVGQIYDGAIYTLREKETGREYGSLDGISHALSGIARLEERDPEILADYLAWLHDLILHRIHTIADPDWLIAWSKEVEIITHLRSRLLEDENDPES